MYNKIILIGNLTKDIELKYAQSGAAIAKTSIATSKKYKTQSGEQKEEVCFVDINAFGRTAEVMNQYVRKGSKVMIEGELVFEQWTAQDGTNRSRHTVRVDTMKMLDSKQDSNGGNQGGYNNNQQQAPQNNNYQQPQNNNNNYQQPQNNNQQAPQIDIDEDEIPF